MCGNTTTTATSTPKPTAEETALNQRNLRIAQATEAGETQAQTSGLSLINQLLAGGQNLPGIFGQLSQGISPNAMAAQAGELTRQALPQFQSSGLVDSGTMWDQISKNIANQLVYPAEQFNIGTKQNLLNTAFTGQAQVQAPVQNNVNSLAQSLAGLRTTTQTQTQTQNPFLTSLMSGLGSVPGQVFGRFGQGSGMFGGGSI